MKRSILAVLATTAAAGSLPAMNPAEACACCTERGQRFVGSTALDDYQWQEVGRMRFAPEATLYIGAGDAENIQGIANPDSTYALNVVREGRSARFEFTSAGGGTGTLSMVLPDKAAFYEIDTRDVPDNGLGPSIYKEWKFTAEPKGTGDFSAATGKGQHLTLILQGRGNNCVQAEDFTHWTLVMEGAKGDYMLFGELGKPD